MTSPTPPAPSAQPRNPLHGLTLEAIVTALGRTNNNLVKTAEMLGISRPTLYDLMHRLGLKSQHS